MAKRFKLSGKNELEEAFIDMYGAQLGDLYDLMVNKITKNETHLLFDEIWPENLSFFESQLNKTGTGYLVGDKMSWADLYLSQMTDFLDNEKTPLLNDFPLVRKLDKKVRSLTSIKKWLTRRHSNMLVLQ